MFKLALVGLGLWGGHRYLKARDLGVPVDRAFKFDNLLTSIDDLKAETATTPTQKQLDAAATQEDREFGPAAVEPTVPRKVFRRAYGDFLPGADEDDYLTPDWM